MRGRSLTADRPKGAQIKSLRFVLRYVRPYRLQLAIALLAMLFTSSAVLGMGAGLRYLVDEGLGKGDPKLLDRSFYVLLAIVGLLAVTSYARSYFIARVGEQVVADIRRAVYQHVIQLSPAFFELTRTGEVLSRLTTDTTLLQSVVGSTITFALRNLLLLIGGTVLLLITSLKLTSFLFLILPVVVVPILVLGRRVRTLSRQTQDKVAELSVHVEESVSSVRTIQAFGLEELRTGEFSGKVTETLDMATARITMRSLLTSIVIALIFGAIAVVLWVGGRDVISGDITPGELSAFVFYAVVVAGAVGAISEVVGDLQRASGAAERLVELLHMHTDITVPEHPVPLPDKVQGHIEYDAVTFHYPTRKERPSLESFSLDVRAGERVALVGPSGAGKTTVLQLLLRFYDPGSGELRLDGIPIRELDPAALRGVIGLVPQDPVIFSSNVWDNIRCGRPDATEAEIRDAAEAAAASEFIDRLPDGYDSYLGEKGVRLSGGQRQRIAIARAVLRNPAILLLDEATSALDSANEKLVQEALERLMAERTSLVIAHRLATIRSADRIVVLDQGCIVAQGTHEELMAEEGLYAKLAKLQFSEPSCIMPAHVTMAEG